MRIAARICVSLMLVWHALLAGGCYHKTVYDGWAKFEEETGKWSSKPGTSDSDSAVAAQGYAIEVAVFAGPTAVKEANTELEKLKNDWNLDDLWVRQSSDAASVMRGRYQTAASEDARRDLESTRLIAVDRGQPYASARLVPLSDEVAVTAGEFDLHQYAGKYSLQVMFFDGQSGGDFRKRAEEAAKALRAEGVEAYYYHSPNMSMVTVGIFDDNDFVRVGNEFGYGDRIHEVQKQFPYNLGNGKPIPLRVDGKVVEGNQPSVIVKVD